MGARRKCLWMIAAIAALPAPAAAANVCSALQRILAASRETTPFESVRRAAAGGEAVVPGFLPEDCWISAAKVSCDHRSMALNQFDAWPNPLACPGFVADQPMERRAWHRDRPWTYSAAGLRIEYGTDCAMCAGPGSARFRASPVRGRVEE